MEYRAPLQPLVAAGAMECHVSDMTATISTEMSLEAVQSRLGQFSQWLAIDGDPEMPVGRLVERNSTGPLRLGFGGWRDLLLGCQFTNGAGELITAGARTMKNVAGYDLTKFMVGQRGIFGRLVTITVRTSRLPVGAIVACLKCSDQLITPLMATPLRPHWALLEPGGLWCGYLGNEAALNLYEGLLKTAQVKEIGRRSLQEDIEDRAQRWHGTGEYFRAAVPPTKILQFIQKAGVKGWAADAAFGIVVGRAAGVDLVALSGAAASVSGSVTNFLDNQPPQWLPNAIEMTILSRLKSAFDSEAHLPNLFAGV